VPDSFRFSVKFPRSVTHERRLIDCEELVEQFVSEIAGLGDRLGVVLVQLPPSLRFDSDIAARFFRALREWTHAPIAFEPRHRTWFTSEVDVLLTEHDISRVAADPPVVPAAAVPGGSSRVAYYRLHGSPRMYYSSYEPSFLADLAGRLASYREPDHVWCIFDNTAANAAIENGLRLLVMLRTPVCDSRPVC
jgi:uncharacterized protein YecE (DUF72 family)